VFSAERGLTYGALVAEARALGGALAAQTQRPVVALYMPMTTSFVSAFLGTLYSGRAALPLNLMLPVEQLGPILADSGADIIVTLPDFKPKLAALPARVLGVNELKPAPGASLRPPRPEDLCTLLYTSGSTGAPKGVELTFANITSNALASVEAMEMSPRLRVLACLPTFHTFAITATTVAELVAGASIVALPKFDPELMLTAASQQRCTLLVMIPSMFRLLIRRQESRKLPMEHLEMAVSGAEPLPAEVGRRFREVFGLELLEGYGMTESSPVIAVNRRGRNKPGTVGLPLPGVRVKIVDPDSLAEAPTGQTGEVWVHGSNVMRGYHNRPAETAQVITFDGWLRTGDMGALDAEGFLTITGRLKEMIKVGGEMVFPAEVENALSRHPAVAEAGAIGVKDQVRGESVKAFVALHPGQTVTPDELVQHCRKLLAPYKVPRAIEILPALPKTPTGKVLRRLLK
jgi:long-chain acyl-CoA synthetase